jgi:hypothetical protein
MKSANCGRRRALDIINFVTQSEPIQANMKKCNVRIAIGTGLMLLIPLVLTLLASWHWRPGAFVLAFLLLVGGAGLTYELVAKKRSNKAYRFAVGVALAAVFLLVWMNAAVGGILGDDPANMMYFGVLLVGIHRRRHRTLRATGNVARVVCDGARYGASPCDCVDHRDTRFRQRRGGSVWSPCSLRHAVCRIGVVVSTRKRQSLMKMKILFATLLTPAPIVLAIPAEVDDYGYAVLQRVREF